MYLSIYPPPEITYRVEKKPAPFGTTLRLGSTSMWGGVRLINGYSPIRPAGVAREFDVAIHGEIAPWAAEYFPEREGGPEGKLAQIGVDGIIVARELEIAPRPEAEWELVQTTDEGRIFHREGEPLPIVRSVAAEKPETGEQFARASVERIHDRRNAVEADVAVPAGGRPALLTFSRPYFRGYRATLDGRVLSVISFRGLLPAVEIPAGMNGHLVLAYRPWWLVTGAAVAVGCALVCLAGIILNLRRER